MQTQIKETLVNTYALDFRHICCMAEYGRVNTKRPLTFLYTENKEERQKNKTLRSCTSKSI